jgi:hypothetical protein
VPGEAVAFNDAASKDNGAFCANNGKAAKTSILDPTLVRIMCRSPFGTVGSPVHSFEMLSEIGYKTASLFDDVVPERIVASRSLARLFYSILLKIDTVMPPSPSVFQRRGIPEPKSGLKVS